MKNKNTQNKEILYQKLLAAQNEKMKKKRMIIKPSSVNTIRPDVIALGGNISAIDTILMNNQRKEKEAVNLDNIDKDESASLEMNETNIKEKKQKKQVNRQLKLIDTLLSSKNGIKNLYEEIMKLKIGQNSEHNLNKFIKLIKSWHFSIYSKYEFNFFLNRVTELSNKSSIKVSLYLKFSTPYIHIYNSPL